MQTRSARRVQRRRVRRGVAVAMTLGMVGLGVGFASPASAGGRYRDHGGASNNGCASNYTQDSYQGRNHSNDTAFSNEGYCSFN